MNELELLRKDVSDFFIDPQKQIYKLQGGPGTGKSHSVISLIDAYLNVRKAKCLFDDDLDKVVSSNIFITATTHKAVAALEPVVKQIESTHAIRVFSGTIHSFLGLKGFNCFRTGKLLLKPDTKNTRVHIEKDAIVVLDEASYANQQIYDLLMDLLQKRPDVKLLLVMDKRQGKVIEEGVSNFVTQVEQSFEIVTRRRYPENSAIHLNSLMLESLIDGNTDIQPFIEDDTFEIITEEQAQAIIDRDLVVGNEDLRIIAYRNARVVKYNEYVHTSKYNNDTFNVGQRVVSPEFQKVNDVTIGNDLTFVIESVNPNIVTHSFTTYLNKEYSIDCYQIKLKGIPNWFKVPRSFSKYQSILISLSKTKEWSALFNFKGSILDIRHSWAITCYKSQGSTYDYAIVDTPDLEGIEDLDDFYRMLNVSITRARKKTYIIINE